MRKPIATMLALALGLATFIGIGRARAEPDTHSANYWMQECSGESLLCYGFISAMRDMNDIDGMEGRGKHWCEPEGVTGIQLRQIILNALNKTPETWQLPFAFLGIKALSEKFPCAKPTR
jgi:hypothetical protein